jgi:plastocyanin
MSRSRSLTLVAAATVLVMVVAFSVAADASPTRRGTTTTIRGVSSAYSNPHWAPKTANIAHGDKVKWLAVNYTHHLVAYGGNWTFNRNLTEGQSASKKFNHAGTYLFRCTIHSTLTNGHCEGMCGKVVVH